MLNFPSNPTLNQTFTANSIVWKWDGTGWNISPANNPSFDTVIAANGFYGNLTGNVTGNVTGNLGGNVTGNLVGTVTGSLIGNASTATKLSTPRLINGVSFDGTSDIAVQLTPSGSNGYIQYNGNGSLSSTSALTYLNSILSAPAVATVTVTASGAISVGTNLTVSGTAYVGTGASNTALTNPSIVARGVSSISQPGQFYTQIALENGSASGSGDFISYVDTYPGTSSDHGWIDTGITGSTFGDPNFTITGRQDGYIFSSSTVLNPGTGNLVFATDSTGTKNDIVWATGGFLAANEKMRFIHATGQLYVETITASTSTSTGALRVAGGVGVGGALYASTMYEGTNRISTMGRSIAMAMVFG